MVGILGYIFALAAGVANPAQAGANAELNKELAAPVWAAAFVYISGFAAVMLIECLVRGTWPGSRFSAVPWWAWFGGVLSVGSTFAGLTLAQKMGSGTFTGLSLTASVLSSILLDQFGLLGFKPHPAHAFRLIGAGMMIGGLWLVAKN